MIFVAFQIFGVAAGLTGVLLLLLTAYVKRRYRVEVSGFKAQAGEPGGVLRFWVYLALGLIFLVSGLTLYVLGMPGPA